MLRREASRCVFSVDRVAELGEVAGLESPCCPRGEAAFMREFFEQIGAIRAKISALHTNLEITNELCKKFVTTTSLDQSTFKEDVLVIQDQSTALIKEILFDLTRMPEPQALSLEARIRQNMHNVTCAKFTDLLNEYHELQMTFVATYRDHLVRKIKIIDPAIKDEQLEERLASATPDDWHFDLSGVITTAAAAAAREIAPPNAREPALLVMLQQHSAEVLELCIEVGNRWFKSDITNNIEFCYDAAVEYVETDYGIPLPQRPNGCCCGLLRRGRAARRAQRRTKEDGGSS